MMCMQGPAIITDTSLPQCILGHVVFVTEQGKMDAASSDSCSIAAPDITWEI